VDKRIVQHVRVQKDVRLDHDLVSAANTVQDIVVGNRQFADGAKANDIAGLLLIDDKLVTLCQTRCFIDL